MRKFLVPTIVLALYFGTFSSAAEPQVDNVTLLREGRFSELEQNLEKLRVENRLNTKGWSQLTEALDVLASAGRKDPVLERQLDVWCEYSPNSYLAFTTRGYFNRESAWDVWEQEWKKRRSAAEIRGAFTDKLHEAKADLEKAYELDHTSPYAPTVMLHVIANIERSGAPAKKYFDQAVAANPNLFEAYAWMSDLMEPNWGGKSEEMFKFAHDAVAAHSDDPRFGLLIVYAHKAKATHSEEGVFEYFSDAKIQQEIRDLLSKYMKAYPNSWEGHNELAHFAYLAKDYPLARRQFELIGEIWTPWTWHMRRGHFEKARRHVYRKTGSLKYTLYNSTEELWLSIIYLAIFIILAWRAFSKEKVKDKCPQCGQAVLPSWRKAFLGPAMFIDCPSCRGCITVASQSVFFNA